VNVDAAEAAAPRQRNLFSALFTAKDEEDDSEAAAAPAPKPERKADKKAEKIAQTKQAATKVADKAVPPARPAERATAKVEPKAAPAASFNLASAESRPVALTTTATPPTTTAAAAKADTTGAVAPWPVKVADAGNSMPSGLALSYAQANQPPQAPVTRSLTAPNAAPRDSAGMQPIRVADAANQTPAIQTASAAPAPTLKAGLPPDDLWLRALVLAPNLQNYLTATVLGQSDMRELLPLMEKPDAVVTMGFGSDPNLGLATDRFTGGAAVVFVPTTVFEKKRTAALQ
jgi:hypothetical protein